MLRTKSAIAAEWGLINCHSPVFERGSRPAEARKTCSFFATKDCFFFSLALRLLQDARRCREREQGHERHHNQESNQRVATLPCLNRDTPSSSQNTSTVLTRHIEYLVARFPLRLVIFRLYLRGWASEGRCPFVAFARQSQGVLDFKIRVDNNQFMIRDTGNTESSAEYIATLNAQNFFTRFVLQERGVADMSWLADDAHVSVIGCRWRGDAQRCLV